ncbi:MAG: ECF-type sigma factor [Verrucomicrobiota bacterium]
MPKEPAHPPSDPTHAAFPTTCWTLIVDLKPDADPALEQRLLEELSRKYWFPLYAFARHRGMTSHDGEDAVQSFFLHIANAEYFRKADHDKGKLRTFILTGFTRHLKDLKAKTHAQKRGGGILTLSLDTDQAEEWLHLAPGTKPEDETLTFEHHWATNLIRIVLANLEQQAAANTRTQHRFKTLSQFIDPSSNPTLTIKEAAKQLEISPAACEKAVQRIRHDFRLAIREQIAATLRNPTEDSIIAELQQLQQALTKR